MYPSGYYPPQEGWEESTWYLIEVSYRSSNPIHHALFFSGFLNGKDGSPGGYSCIIPFNGWAKNDGRPDQGARYFKVVKKLVGEKELPEIV